MLGASGHEITAAVSTSQALPILAAATLTQDVCIIENVPNILDIQIMMKGIECLGAKVTYQNGRVTIDGSGNHMKYTVPTSTAEIAELFNIPLGLYVFGKKSRIRLRNLRFL